MNDTSTVVDMSGMELYTLTPSPSPSVVPESLTESSSTPPIPSPESSHVASRTRSKRKLNF